MSTINSICVYCASGPGTNPAFMEAATKLGRILAENNIRLVYGGRSGALMGALPESVLHPRGSGTGGIPEFLAHRRPPQPRPTPARSQARQHGRPPSSVP